MGHYVYKYVLNDEIIYIGKCDKNLEARIKQHGKVGDNINEHGWEDLKKSEIYYCSLINNTMADVVESELIRRYKPKYNIAKKNSEWGGLEFVEPTWTLYTFSHQAVLELQNKYNKLQDKYNKLKGKFEKLIIKNKSLNNDYTQLLFSQERQELNFVDKLNMICDKCVDKKLLNAIHNPSLHIETSTPNGVCLEEVVRRWREDGECKVYYSLAYDENGELVSWKEVYPEYDVLRYYCYLNGYYDTYGILCHKDKNTSAYSVFEKKGNPMLRPLLEECIIVRPSCVTGKDGEIWFANNKHNE